MKKAPSLRMDFSFCFCFYYIGLQEMFGQVFFWAHDLWNEWVTG